MLLLGFSFAPRGQSYEKITLTVATIFAVLISFIDAKPSSQLPKRALEKFYHEMLQRSSITPQPVGKTTIQRPNIEQELLKKIYQKQTSVRDKRHTGIISRTRIYSISSKGYLTVKGSFVSANGSGNSEYAVMIMEFVGFGKVRLRGEKSNRYICFNRKGKIVAQLSPYAPDCIYRTYTSLPDHYTAFRSASKLNFWLGARPRGFMKKGKRTAMGQRATKFIVVRFRNK